MSILKKAAKVAEWCHETEESWTNYHLTRYRGLRGGDNKFNRTECYGGGVGGGLEQQQPHQVEVPVQCTV